MANYASIYFIIVFNKSLSNIDNPPDQVKCISLNNQQCIVQFTLVNLHPSKYNEGLRYFPFAVNLDRCMESCNSLNDLFNKVYVPNKTKHLNLSVFKMIRRINEP